MSTRLNKHKMCTKGSFIFFNHVHSYMELPMTRSQRSRRRDKGLCRGAYLCSPVPMFPGTDVPRYLCSPVPMFPGTYVPRYRCSPNLCSPVPMFPGTDVPRTYVPRYRCSPVPMFPDLRLTTVVGAYTT